MKILDKIFNRNKKAEPIDADKKIVENSLLFDGEWYCKTYGFGKYLDAANHYLNIGWREGKNPSAFFSTADYLKKNPDVNFNPLVHFEKFGLKENRYRAEIEKVLPAILCESELPTPATPNADIAECVAASAKRLLTP